MFKKLLGLAPKPTPDGAFSPSSFALKVATAPQTDYTPMVFSNALTQNHRRKVLMVCTQERNMKMANGTYFSTGNHPVEMLLPMLHLNNAGFDSDIYTPTGESVKIEMWAFPEKDEAVKTIYAQYQKQFEQPRSLAEFVQHQMNGCAEYDAVFIPGGHGAMLGLPESQDLNQLIHWSNRADLLMLSICHGPAALLAANLNPSAGFVYQGYSMAAFPDAVDKQTPMIGYMPGHMPWRFGEQLNALGVTIVNRKADKTCHKDRNLITGASPKAANDFGILAATELLKKVNPI